MIIDGYHCQIKDKQVKDGVIYIVLLISLEGKKEIGGWYIEFGKENRTDWMKIFKDGIKKIMIGCQNFEQAIEEFNLLIEKFKKKYPYFIKKIEANEYEILQLFNLRFGRKEVSQTQNS
jgi:hypothetical protein